MWPHLFSLPSTQAPCIITRTCKFDLSLQFDTFADFLSTYDSMTWHPPNILDTSSLCILQHIKLNLCNEHHPAISMVLIHCSQDCFTIQQYRHQNTINYTKNRHQNTINYILRIFSIGCLTFETSVPCTINYLESFKGLPKHNPSFNTYFIWLLYKNNLSILSSYLLRA